MISAIPAPAADHLTDAPRTDGWTPDRQVIFLEHLANHGVVADAAKAAGMGLSGAYALRRRDAHFAFDLAWQAANLLARQHITDALITRALTGQESVTEWGDGRTVRQNCSNRLGLSLMDRIDPAKAPPEVTAVAQGFHAFLNIILEGSAPDDIRAFFKSRIKGSMSRHTALYNLPLPEETEEEEVFVEQEEFGIWQDGVETLCNFPPPPGFSGYADGHFNDRNYRRSLSDEEYAALVKETIEANKPDPEKLARGIAARDAAFHFVPKDPKTDGAKTEAAKPDYEVKSMPVAGDFTQAIPILSPTPFASSRLRANKTPRLSATAGAKLSRAKTRRREEVLSKRRNG